MSTTQIMQTQGHVPSGMIDLGLGHPASHLLPLEMIERAAHHRLKQDDISLLQYGPEQGDGYFRLALAKFLTDNYDRPVEDDQLLITTGASQGLDLIATHFAQAGDTVFVEEPTYFLALNIFSDYHLNLVPLPMDEEGIIIEVLEAKLKSYQPAFLYTIPTFHNPSGVTLSASRREQLVRLSEEYDFLIVADEVYHLLAYTLVPPPPLCHYDQQGTVLSLGSFSKILGPGLRLGWVQATPDLLKRLVTGGLLRSGGSLNHFTSAIVRTVLESGWQQEHLTRLKRDYQRRANALTEALRIHLPDPITFMAPQGGYFIWVQVPRDTSSLLDVARKNQVGFQPGVRFSAEQNLRHYLRLSFSYYGPDELELGAQRLANLLQ